MKTFIRAVIVSTFICILILGRVYITRAEEVHIYPSQILSEPPQAQEIHEVPENSIEDVISDNSNLIGELYIQDEVFEIYEECVESEDLVESKSHILYSGYTTAPLNIREEPSMDSEIAGIIPFNVEVEFTEYNNDWYEMHLNGREVYLYSEYVSTEEIPYISKDVSGDVRKSFMDYSLITSPKSRQYKLQSGKAYTGDDGIRMINGRYLVALGSNFSRDIGQYLDLVLENGTVIPCILGDCKADAYTMNNNSQGLDGSTAEFIIQTSSISKKVKSSGDCSNVDESWNSPVVEIRLYKKNVFD